MIDILGVTSGHHLNQPTVVIKTHPLRHRDQVSKAANIRNSNETLRVLAEEPGSWASSPIARGVTLAFLPFGMAVRIQTATDTTAPRFLHGIVNEKRDIAIIYG
ncbi:MAG: hypothetical protein WEA24_15955 [Gemmatimonadota bacterium]